MTQAKSNRKQITDIILIVLIVVCVGFILVEMTNNLTNELEAQNQTTITTIQQQAEPTPRPTLTAEEREDIFSAPIE
ncbi:hypothetical protein [Candidatus Leptofilum sp.]|uniref:hypothetical protein n=1 Tax=Candidatus Leptofilum sp. TaxID=3241576 RepID=UPI003B595D2A